MHSNPLITVYVTNYNYGHFIKKAIDSILDQTYTDYEVIIIDDGSTDNSSDIIETYSKIPNFRVVYQHNKGLIVANNMALRLATGKYIMRLDADDYLDKNALLILQSELEKDSELGLVFANYFIVDSNENIISYRERIGTEANHVLDNPAHGACTMIRVDFLREIGGYDEKFTCQDGYYLWINFVTRYKVKHIDTPLFYYRQHGSNLTTNYDKIVSTRSNIIYEHNHDLTDSKKLKSIAIIPIRGVSIDRNCPALEMIDNEINILHFFIEQVSKSEYLDKIVVTSSDIDVLKEAAKIQHPKFMIIERPQNLSRFNSGLNETVDFILSQIENIENYFAITTLSIEFPLLKYTHIDNAIKSMRIYDTNSTISVRQDNNKYYMANEYGLYAILNQDKFSKLEREDLYRYCGGLITTKMAYYLENKKFVSDKSGHIIIDDFSTFKTDGKYGIYIIKKLYSKYKQDAV